MNQKISSSLSHTTDIVSQIKRSQETGLNRDQRFNQIMFWRQILPDDSEIMQMAEEPLQQAEFKNLTDPNPFRATNPRLVGELPGEILIGAIQEYNIPYLLPMCLITNHILVFGRTGGGKTNLILLILAQILEKERNA